MRNQLVLLQSPLIHPQLQSHESEEGDHANLQPPTSEFNTGVLDTGKPDMGEKSVHSDKSDETAPTQESVQDAYSYIRTVVRFSTVARDAWVVLLG